MAERNPIAPSLTVREAALRFLAVSALLEVGLKSGDPVAVEVWDEYAEALHQLDNTPAQLEGWQEPLRQMEG